MKLNQLSPILWTKNLPETVAFYENVLGFQSRSNFPDFASIYCDGIEIMFVVPQAEQENCNPEEEANFFPHPILTGSIFIYMEGVDSLWDRLKDNVTIRTSIADRNYGMRDFSILDNNGYELVFGENSSKVITDPTP